MAHDQAAGRGGMRVSAPGAARCLDLIHTNKVPKPVSTRVCWELAGKKRGSDERSE